MKESYKRYFKPKFPEKYRGNSKGIFNRSTWETMFCKWCDENRNILEWSSEELAIPYISPVDNKPHRYFPDFVIKVKEKDGKINTYIVEIKPLLQTHPPKFPGKKTKKYLYEAKSYAINTIKWKYAQKYAEQRGWKFMLITEKELGLDGTKG